LSSSDSYSDALFGIFNYGLFGGKDLRDSLNYHDLNTSRTGNEFEYLLGGNLLSYVIKERTRMTPEEFIKTKAFPLMGIADEDFVWQRNRDGMSYSWHGLFMTVRAMAKLGMLYLQRGHPNANDTIVEESFVIDSARGTTINPGYGYGLWSADLSAIPPERPTRYLAGGLGDQMIFVDEILGRVIALTSDNYGKYIGINWGEVDESATALAEMVADPDCSFLI